MHTVDIRLINITHAVLCQRLLWVDGIAGVDTSVNNAALENVLTMWK